VRAAVLGALGLWAGTTILLSGHRWFSRRSLAERLGPFHPNGASVPRPGILSVESVREVVGPLSESVGSFLSRLFGVSEELSLRLERVHSPYDVTAFRVRQLGGAVVAVLVAGLGALLLRPPLPLTVIAVVSAPALPFLLLEQQVAAQSAAWQRRVFLELQVVAEQLAMLVSSGYSLGAALNRLADRGRGACARDLRRVTSRMRQGLTEIDALREWAAVVHVDALDRLIPVLALSSEATDLGRLVSEEARNIRRDVQRQQVETMERRAQSVWIPVTVATLVPGVILLAIPFMQALKLFAAG
jgi:tight adherence protein C